VSLLVTKSIWRRPWDFVTLALTPSPSHTCILRVDPTRICTTFIYYYIIYIYITIYHIENFTATTFIILYTHWRLFNQQIIFIINTRRTYLLLGVHNNTVYYKCRAVQVLHNYMIYVLVSTIGGIIPSIS